MRRSLKAKIALGYAVIVLLFTMTSLWTIHAFTELSGAVRGIMVNNYRSVLAAQNMIEALERQDSALLLVLFGQRDEGQEVFLTNQSNFLASLERAQDNVTEPGESNAVQAIRSDYQQYMAAVTKLRDNVAAQGLETGRQNYLNDISPIFEKTKAECRNLLNLNQQAMVDSQAQAAKLATRSSLSVSLVSLLAVILGTLFSINAANFIIRPIRELMAKVRLVSEGKLDQVTTIKSEDEIGQLSQEFNQMVDRLAKYDKANIARIIAEQKKADAIVRSINDALVVIDDQYRVILMNPAAERLFNVKEEIAFGHHFLETIPNQDLFALIKAEGQHSNNGSEGDGPHTLSMDFADKTYHFRVEATAVEGEEQQLLGVVCMLQDITHFKEIDQLKSDFVSTVSHELRTPLTSMTMSIGLLSEEVVGPLTDKQKELLHVADEDCQRLTKMVSDLLDLSKIESGRVQMDFAPVDVDSLFVTACKALRVQAEEKGIRLHAILPTGLPLVKADGNKVTWVLINLIANALRYTPTKGEIKLSAVLRDRRAYLSVADTGIGIPKAYREQIFEKFVQVKGDHVTSGGAGLGLAIAREIIRAHGGRIWVDSELGRGSTFTLTLPLADTPAGGGDPD